MDDVTVVALGLSDPAGVFVVGLLEGEIGEKTVKMSHCVRMYEIADPADPRRVGLTWHPDPMMTSEHVMTFQLGHVLCYRLLGGSEEMAIKYRSFLTEFRLRRSGLISGVNSLSDAQRRIITEES